MISLTKEEFLTRIYNNRALLITAIAEDLKDGGTVQVRITPPDNVAVKITEGMFGQFLSKAIIRTIDLAYMEDL